jgi:tripeptide aminopeptidase
MNTMKKIFANVCIMLLFSCTAQQSEPMPAGPPGGSVEPEPEYLNEIETLSGRADVQSAFRIIEEFDPQTQIDHITLNEVPAPPFMEEERALKFADMLRNAGADAVTIDAVGNVVALRRGQDGTRTVALDGHLDTVFPEGTDVTVTIRDDTLFAPGIGDDTRGLAVVIAVLKALERAQIETRDDVLFIGTVGEEGLGDLRGVKQLFSESGPGIDSWISVDGGGIDRISHGGLGSHRYRVTFRGPGGHSWGAFGLGNTHHALGRAITYFTDEADEYTRSGSKTTYSVGRIGGGTSINAIPFASWMEVDMRSIVPERVDGIDAIFQRAVQRALDDQNALNRDGPPMTVDIELVGDRPSGSTDLLNPLVQRAIAATKSFGHVPSAGIGSTNANLPMSVGVPAISIGRGGVGGGGHSLREWWLNKDGHKAVQYVLTILLAEAGISD